MAKGYWIVRVSARNAERYPEYVAATRLAYEKFGARILGRGGRCDTDEPCSDQFSSRSGTSGRRRRCG